MQSQNISSTPDSVLCQELFSQVCPHVVLGMTHDDSRYLLISSCAFRMFWLIGFWWFCGWGMRSLTKYYTFERSVKGFGSSHCLSGIAVQVCNRRLELHQSQAPKDQACILIVAYIEEILGAQRTKAIRICDFPVYSRWHYLILHTQIILFINVHIAHLFNQNKRIMY